MNANAIRSIAVAGGGIVGLSAALAFKRSLPQAKVDVIGTPLDPAALADRLPTAWPTIHRFHALIGLDERELVRDGIAVHHLGTIVEGWPGAGASWVQAFAAHGKPVGSVAFDQVWLRARQAGQARPYDAYSMGAVLARAGKFAHPSGDQSSVSARFAYGLRFDSDLYRRRLADVARSVGIDVRDSDVCEPVAGAPHGLAALQLGGGERIEADLFVDCTGPGGRLIAAVDRSFEPWLSHRMTSIEVARSGLDAPCPTARICGAKDGWLGEWPLPDGKLTVTARADKAGMTLISPGRRTRPWSANVLALGDAATAIDPLHGMNLDLAHRAMMLALELLPGRDMNPLVLAEYNRRAALIAEQARDFIALHYAHEAAAHDIPRSLARRLDQFEHRGRLPFQEEETLGRDDWTAALLGLGYIPDATDPAAGAVPLDRAAEAMEELADDCARTAARVPDYGDYLRRMVSPSSAAT